MYIYLCVLVLLSLFVVNCATADIYRSISQDGVECYTDAPINRESVLVIREHRRVNKKVKKFKETVPASSRNSLPAARPLSTQKGKYSLPVQGLISSSVGLRYDPIDGVLKSHKGVDIAIPEGSPVKPVAAGVVSYSGTRGGYGNIVIVEHGGGMTTLYAHNSSNLTSCGDRVNENTIIALTGSTGRSTGPHLHFEAWLDGQNITTDFLGGSSSLQRPSSSKVTERKISTIRKVVMADGSVYLTNLPLVHP
ncbi:MAG: M23 family metallopeptidase [Deltaproteobacteria bacterium]|nr:M23 family metallopeptidase [Deltaproteobacteria bacterium]TLN03788.1 MAG: M23 family metallopeptidase [bacterium]